MPYIGNKTSKFKTADELTVTGDATVTGSVDATSYTGDGSSLTGISSDLVDDTTPQLGGDLSTNGNDINFGDNDKAQFGAGNDLQIYHDGSNSYVHENGTGSLNILATDQIKIGNSANSEVYAKFNSNGNVELRHDNTVRLETTSSGVEVTGDLRVGDTGNGSFKAVSGQYGSIEIDGGAHGAYEGYSIGGRVVLMHNNIGATGIYNDVDNQWLFHGTHGSSSYLYHNGVSKIYTASYGIGITGNPWCWAEGSNNLRVDLRAGSAKYWLNMTQYNETSARDSYNHTSLTDNGTGDFTATINNDMNNRNYSYTACGQRGNNAIEDYSIMAYQNNYNTAHNTGSLRLVTMFASSASHSDMNCNTIQICGDLA